MGGTVFSTEKFMQIENESGPRVGREDNSLILPVLLEVVIMSVLHPRFEFRAFAQTFGIVEDEIRRGSVCHDIGESTETYLIAIDVEEQNVKVRDGRLAIKRLVERRQRLERWEPVMDEAVDRIRKHQLPTGDPAYHGSGIAAA
jgi:hypothetical protein